MGYVGKGVEFGVEFTDDISGKSNSESKQFVKGTSFKSVSVNVLF